MWPVVGAVNDDRVLRDPQLVQLIEQGADHLVVVDHGVVVHGLPAPGLTDALWFGVGAKVHVGGVEPDEEGGIRFHLAADEVLGGGQELVVDRLHPLLCERAGIFDPLRAVRIGPGMEHAPRAVPLAEVRVVLRRRIVGVLGLLFGIEVVEVAKELIEAVRGRQEFVLVAEVVLAELPRRVAEWFEQLGDGRILGLESDVRAGEPDLAQPGAEDVLAGDEGGRPAVQLCSPYESVKRILRRRGGRCWGCGSPSIRRCSSSGW